MDIKTAAATTVVTTKGAIITAIGTTADTTTTMAGGLANGTVDTIDITTVTITTTGGASVTDISAATAVGDLDSYTSFVNAGPSYTYCNPYCVAGVTSVYDYSQPLGPAGDDQQLSEIASTYFAEAREAFYAGDLKTAMEKIELAIKEMPSNSDLHQFRSLVLFSMKEFRQAAASAHVALTAGPGWNWDTLQKLVPLSGTLHGRAASLGGNSRPKQTRPGDSLSVGLSLPDAQPCRIGGEGTDQVVALEPRDELAAKILKTITDKMSKPSNRLSTNNRPSNRKRASKATLPDWERWATPATRLRHRPTKWNSPRSPRDRKRAIRGKVPGQPGRGCRVPIGTERRQDICVEL